MKFAGENAKTIAHDFPVWREKANFILATRLCEPDVPEKWEWEQIWARQVAENMFEICCIPFFAYGLALGDFVNVEISVGEKHIINQVVRKGGHTTYRVWFYDISKWDLVTKQIRKLDCLVEMRWDKSKFIGVDVSTFEIRKNLEEYLLELEREGTVKCEIANA